MQRFFWELQYRDLHTQFRSSYDTFFGSCCYETEKFAASLCFDSSEHSVQTADDNNEVSNFTNALVLNIFKLVLYFNSTVINNQIRHHLTTTRRNFLETQFGFKSMKIHCGLLLKRVFTTRDLRKLKPGM